jgi:hypothetical protein
MLRAQRAKAAMSIGFLLLRASVRAHGRLRPREVKGREIEVFLASFCRLLAVVFAGPVQPGSELLCRTASLCLFIFEPSCDRWTERFSQYRSYILMNDARLSLKWLSTFSNKTDLFTSSMVVGIVNAG